MASRKGYVLHVSSNGMVTIPMHVKREMGITEETPLKLEVVGPNKMSLTKMLLVEDSVAFHAWRTHPVKISRARLVSDVRRVRKEFFDAGEQGA